MRPFARSIIILLVLCVGVSHAAAPSAPPPVWAFFKNPMMSKTKISPSGNYIASIISKQGIETILVWNIRTNEKKPILKFPGANYQIDWLEWASDRRIVLSMQYKEAIGGAGYLATRLHAVDRDGENLRELTKNWELDKHPLANAQLVSMFDEDESQILVSWLGRVVAVNLDSGNSTTYQARAQDLAGFQVDPHDRVRGGWKRRRDQTKMSFYARVRDTEPFKKLQSSDPAEGPRFFPVGFHDQDPSLLYAVSDHETGRLALYEYDIEANEFGERLFASDRYDLSPLPVLDGDNRTVGVFYATDTPQHKIFDPGAAALQARIDRALPDSFNRVTNYSRDSGRMIIESASATRLPRTYLYLAKEGQMIELSQAYPDLRDDQLGKAKTLNVTARDGLQFRAFLTLPPGAKPKNLPIVALVHGGPASRDVVRYDPWVQFLASRGYGVLQANYRGSTGYGWKFQEKGHRQWGLTMQDDVTDAVRLLVDKGVADPQRIAIVGGSYGGYASYMGVIREPELFRCGASYGGVSDLHLLIDQDSWYFDGDAFTKASIGAEVKDREKLARTSPARLASRVTRPILVAHSKDDQRVVFSHSEKMIEALEEAGAPHETLLLDYGMHHLNVERERIEFFETLEDFLARCTAPLPQAS